MRKNKNSTQKPLEKKLTCQMAQVRVKTVGTKNAAKVSETELLNKYGTYEIQPTADTENQYPAIAQGFNPKIISTDCENPRKDKPHP